MNSHSRLYRVRLTVLTTRIVARAVWSAFVRFTLTVRGFWAHRLIVVCQRPIAGLSAQPSHPSNRHNQLDQQRQVIIRGDPCCWLSGPFLLTAIVVSSIVKRRSMRRLVKWGVSERQKTAFKKRAASTSGTSAGVDGTLWKCPSTLSSRAVVHK